MKRFIQIYVSMFLMTLLIPAVAFAAGGAQMLNVSITVTDIKGRIAVLPYGSKLTLLNDGDVVKEYRDPEFPVEEQFTDTVITGYEFEPGGFETTDLIIAGEGFFTALITITSGPVSGRVVVDGTYNGIEGVSVRIQGKNVSDLTDSDGYFCIDGVNTEDTLAAEMDGFTFVPASKNIVGGLGGIKFRCTQANIKGRIKTALGDPLEGITVELEGSTYDSAISDIDGLVVFSDLAASGTYTLNPEMTGYIFKPNYESNLRIGADETFLVDQGPVSGVITSATGSVRSDVTMNLSEGSSQLHTAISDSDGEFLFTCINWLSDGAHYTLTPSFDDVTFEPPSRQINALARNVGFEMRFGVFGSVIDAAGAPVPDVTVRLRMDCGDVITKTTNSKGEYGFTHIPEDVCRIEVQPPPDIDNVIIVPVNAVYADPFVLESTHKDVNFVISAEVRGQVECMNLNSGSLMGFAGVSITGSVVYAEGDESVTVAFEVLTDAEGEYVVSELPLYARIDLFPSFPGFKMAPVHREVATGEGSVSGIDFVATGLLSGRIVYASQPGSSAEGAKGITVEITQLGEPLPTTLIEQTGSSGEFLFEGMPEGYYKVEAAEPGHIFEPGMYNNVATGADELEFIVVQSPPTLGPINDLDLPPGGEDIFMLDIYDRETELDDLQISVTSSDTSLVPISDFSERHGIYLQQGSDGWEMGVYPVTNRVGSSIITVTVRDDYVPAGEVVRRFSVTVGLPFFVPDSTAVLASDGVSLSGSSYTTGVPSGWIAQAYGRNDNGEFVGRATKDDGSSCLFYACQSLFADLNELIALESGLPLLDDVNALTINNDRAISGMQGTQEWKLLRGVAVGQPIVMPTGVAIRQPLFTENGPDGEGDMYEWAEGNNQLFPLRPGKDTVEWFVSEDPATLDTVAQVVRSGWPRNPQVHIAGAPVKLKPLEESGAPYRFYQISYQENASTDYDNATGIFNATESGWTVLCYLDTGGQELQNPMRQHSLYQVVRTVLWNAPDAPASEAPELSISVGDAIIPRASRASALLPGPDRAIEIEARDVGVSRNGRRFTLAPSLAGEVSVEATSGDFNITFPADAESWDVAAALNENIEFSSLFEARTLPQNGFLTAVHLSGSSTARVEHQNMAGLGAVSQDLTFAAWIRLDDADGKQVVFQYYEIKDAADDWKLYRFWVRDGQFMSAPVNIGTGGSSVGPAHYLGIGPPVGEWFHLAVSIIDQGLRICINGENIYENASCSTWSAVNSWSGSDGHFVVGASVGRIDATPEVKGRSLHGCIADVQLWNSALSEEQVVQCVEGDIVESGNAVTCWGLSDVTMQLADNSANGNIGIVINGVPPASEVITAGGWLDHNDPTGTGYVLDRLAPYDGAGPDRALDRDSRQGTILPVNATGGTHPLVVAWYLRNSIGVPWPSHAINYLVDWPDDAPSLVIAGLGQAESFNSSVYTMARVYNQPDPELPGFNPNEEHAAIVAGKLTALRCDLNVLGGHSEPFVLLKYRDVFTDEWRISVNRVEIEDSVYKLHYPLSAGQEVQPPFPMTALPLASLSSCQSGPGWRDVKDKFYAKAAGSGLSNADISMLWYYPLQPGFWMDLDGDNVQDFPDGTEVAFLGYVNGGQGVPTPVIYNISWAPGMPKMQLGETLMHAREGLPEICNQAAVQVVYDGVDPEDMDALRASGRIFDPITDRMVEFVEGTAVPAGIELRSIGMLKEFTGLPFALRCRLLLDDMRVGEPARLIFRGALATKGQPPGSELLLPNIMSAEECVQIKALASGFSGSSTWQTLVDRLYRLTRNPNQVDVDDNGSVDAAVRVGLSIDAGGNVVAQSVVGGTKVLSTGLPLEDAAAPLLMVDGPDSVLSFDGIIQRVQFAEFGARMPSTEVTIEFWVKAVTLSGDIVSLNAHDPDNAVIVGYDNASNLVWRFGAEEQSMTLNVSDNVGEWHHYACISSKRAGVMCIYRDGELKEVDESAGYYSRSSPQEPLFAGGAGGGFQGTIDELRIWSVARSEQQVHDVMSTFLEGTETGLAAYWRFDEASGVYIRDASGRGANGTLLGGTPFWYNSSRDVAKVPNAYITLAFNNDENLPGLPVGLTPLLVDCSEGIYAGDIRVLPSDNVFDERLTLRHDADFGGAPESFEFEWYMYPGSDNPEDDSGNLIYPLSPTGILNPGWITFAFGEGKNQITLGEGGESGLMTISDGRWMMRYRGNNQPPYNALAVGEDTWSDWAGAPNAEPPQAQLAEGYVKRVTRELNPLDARTDDFRNSEVNTYASMLVSAGTRYEGDIAFNPDADNLNSIGLIESYETLFRRACDLSINANFNYAPANDAVLLAATKLSDLYMLLGNEAYGDAVDPTIGFTTADGSVGQIASSLFAFRNQLDSLLTEELTLLRGRDSSYGAPVYARMPWNFTGAEGQVAYQQVYNISDTEPRDGFVDVYDAARLFPQGHGDAWGHYLKAIKYYYQIMNNPNFEWRSRSESILLAGVPIDVDYLDERKFAAIAAAKSRTGREILALTYRDVYTGDADGQWQGYPDTDSERAWGLSEWVRRSGQGACFDWIVGNAILPAVDPDERHTGIERVDRTTVSELTEIVSNYAEIQLEEDSANNGMNPLGLADGALTFDVNPALVAKDFGGQTHYEQIADRAKNALANAVKVFDYANEMTRNLRVNQDTASEFAANVADQEADYDNRLIEMFGYPYDGHKGAGKPYASSYEGPDLLYYMYVDKTDLTGSTASIDSITGLENAGESLTAFYAVTGVQITSLDTLTDYAADQTFIEIEYPLASEGWGFSLDTALMGTRRAPGEIQLAISEFLQKCAAYDQALKEYDQILWKITDQVAGVQEIYGVQQDKISVLNRRKNGIISMNAFIGALYATQKALERTSGIVKSLTEAGSDALPKVVGTSTDAFSAARAGITAIGFPVSHGFGIAADVADVAANSIELGKEQLSQESDLELQVIDSRYEVMQAVWELNGIMRQEPPKRVELLGLQESIEQARGRLAQVMARGVRLLDEREAFRKRASGDVSEYRYNDLAFRIFRNDAIQKYRAQYDLAAKYVYLAATAYDFETTFLDGSQGSGARFFEDIVKQRMLGEFRDGEPIVGQPGLADSLGRLNMNFDVVAGQLGFNNPELEQGQFSLRHELFRQKPSAMDDPRNPESLGKSWRDILQKHWVDNLWDVPEFRRYCRPFAPEPYPGAAGEPGLVIPFSTTVTYRRNFFGWPLGGGEASYDSSRFATKIRSVGVGFDDYPATTLASTPRVYLVPAGIDVLRSASAYSLETREYKVFDQKIPEPFPLSSSALYGDDFIPMEDTLSGSFAEVRRFARFRAYPNTSLFDNPVSDSRLIGRSVWNTRWLLIIPGGTLLYDSEDGLQTFVDEVSDIKLFFETYSYPGE